MTHGTEHHLEHAEHAQHAAHDPFDKRVAMSMAMIAAVLAAVATLSHRSHNQTLQMQGESIRLNSEATAYHTQASDQWNYFQAKKQRMYLYGAQADQTVALNRALAAARTTGLEEGAEMEVSKPGKGDAGADEKAGKARAGTKGNKKRIEKAPTDPTALAAWWYRKVAKYDREADGIEAEARKLVARAKAREELAEHTLEESHHVHHQANRLDFGHLGLELGLVLCSIAVLTKQKGFWLSGIVIAAVGTSVSLSAYLL
jgi:hypothetical protein